jgi:hypothetical protein
MCKFVSGALLSLLIGAVSTANAALISESFDSAASASANGWVAVGNGVDGQVVGWANDNLAGGVAGEGQFNVSRGAETRYADTTLGMTINGNTSGGFTMSGLLNITAIGAGGDTGVPPILGFFSSPTDYLGIMFRNEGALNWGIRMVKTGDGIVLGDGGGPDRNLALNTSRTFSMTFDPTLGANGTITASVSDAGAPISFELSPFQRFQLNSMSFDNFGLFKQGNGADQNEFVRLRIDNVSYTGVGVPEPSTLTLVMLLGTVAFGLRKPRQTQQ